MIGDAPDLGARGESVFLFQLSGVAFANKFGIMLHISERNRTQALRKSCSLLLPQHPRPQILILTHRVVQTILTPFQPTL